MQNTSRCLLSQAFALAIFSVVLGAASDPFVGKWRFNSVKSKLTGERMLIEDLGHGKFRLSYGIESYTFIAEGSDQPARCGTPQAEPSGCTTSISLPRPNVMHMINKEHGSVVSNVIYTISGDTLTVQADNTLADGTIEHSEVTYKRVEKGSGWTGTWQVTGYKRPGAEIVIAPYQSNGLAITKPLSTNAIAVRFDGTEIDVHAPDVPLGVTASGTRPGPNTFTLLLKLNGETWRRQTFQLSPDGKTITVTSLTAGQNTPMTAVLERE